MIQAEQKFLCRAATAHAHSADRTALEELYASNGWKTFIAIAESSGKSLHLPHFKGK
jgi:nuclear protein localization family protein 4